MPGPKSRMKKEEGHLKQNPEKVVTPPMPGPKPRMKKEEGHPKKISETVVTPPMPGPKPRMKKEEGHPKKKIRNGGNSANAWSQAQDEKGGGAP